MRKVEEILFKILMTGAVTAVAGTLILILGTIVLKGLPAMNLDMVTMGPGSGYYLGGRGGVLNAIIGSVGVAGGASILALLIGLPVALYLNVYARKDSLFVSMIRMVLDVMAGVPSIVYGAFGFAIMIAFGMHASMLGGMMAVCLLITPVMTRAIDEVIRVIPHEVGEASMSLGANRLETALKVIARQALPGITAALLLSFGRAIGDAASVLFTAGFTDRITFSPFSPVATLPLAIFFQLASPHPEVQQRAYASAFILTAFVLLLSLSARWFSSRCKAYSAR